ncbi:MULTISPECIES: Kae1-associated kinase Bud32 [Archaeoglobus]|uniref:Probable serine/threonine-protein kinase BUD32 homolog n=3 Tax=Archaeoglobus fulgidus TaxID=2234 RepID=BUD32_ARCFU|nr:MULTISPECIES: Kae1-associated kinase Bud32 [Archaeoglobus]O29592.1 RecName: Full=Probable serine/threonine-protein kinase BUD32 homolog [Archaeoglobus fulgidus DSM 4304]AAB90576.1 O-sialoglycoprotein endopeptidase, putative [Archaeoglobus fulgidus DSM 4304]AIG97543.1 Kae1-associated kinase Bud32 [Archaeoglobus fulgidus DSM 8774]KUJ94252.1 MAG: putative serine/threonine-protein kinase BUD32-like protein [Archaeoglobus fulgidus]KUK07527.1 MAG: putative serine/threonine-protein kinase BUD32-li
MKVYLGGEAEVKILENVVVKTRIPKRYRIKELDRELRLRRTKMEAKIISAARRAGVPTPIVLDVEEDTIVMERIYGEAVKDVMSKDVSREVGRMAAKLHRAGIIHGDITPMNLILSNSRIYFVDFGLAFFDNKVEPMGVDVHVYFESLKASFENWERLRDAFIEGYLAEGGSEEVIERAKEIEERGRYVERVSMG